MDDPLVDIEEVAKAVERVFDEWYGPRHATSRAIEHQWSLLDRSHLEVPCVEAWVR